MSIRKVLLASLTLLVATAATAHAQDWPQQRPVKIIVPFAPGGNADGMARIVSARFNEVFGRQFWWRTAPAPAVRSRSKASHVRRPTGTHCCGACSRRS